MIAGSASSRSWKWTTLGEVAAVITGTTPPTKDHENYGDAVPFVKPTELVDGPIHSAPQGLTAIGLRVARAVPPGSVLVSCIGVLGKTGIARTQVAFNQQINAIVFNETVLPDFGLYYAQTLRPWLHRQASATTLPIVNKGKFQRAPFPLVPLDDQRRIVAELEMQFSRLDKAVASLNRVKANLRNLRASALNAACEGPWPSIEFGSLARETLVGLDRGRDQQRSVGPGHRYVKMNNVSMDGEIRLEGMVYVDASSQEATRYALRSGDILFNTRNSVELVGKSALVPPALEGALYNNNLMRIRTTPEIDPAFLAMQMCATAFRRQLEKVKRATTSVAAIYLKDLVRVPVIVPPVTEQCRIVAEVERHLSVIREVEAEVDANLKRAQGLRQAVLQRAFTRGRP